MQNSGGKVVSSGQVVAHGVMPTTIDNAQGAVHQTVHGEATLQFQHGRNGTALADVYYHDPLKILFPHGDVPTAALITTGGGLFGGDRYAIKVDLGTQAQALVVPQAAEKVYRSKGATCHVDVHLHADVSAGLEWLPQETILFEHARLRRNTHVHAVGDARVLAGEMVVFGRLARGEHFTQGLLRDAWFVRRDGRLVWADALHMDGAVQPCLDHMAGFGGARALATAVYVAPDAAVQLDAARNLMDSAARHGVRHGATLVNGVLVCRWLADDPYAMRQAFAVFWAGFRAQTLGRVAQLPRLWSC
jgi:urease accessory protein